MINQATKKPFPPLLQFRDESEFWEYFEANPKRFPEGTQTKIEILLKNGNSYGNPIVFHSPLEVAEGEL